MEAMGIIFSNIYDNNMGELTRERTSASIPFGSRYRQIDFALSNMANSKISNIGIVTKYNYQSLMDHLGNCEEWDLKLGEGVRFLPPYATGHTGAYRGKLEALQTAMPVLGRCDAEYVVLSDTTVLCAINFAAVLDEHIASGCDITVIAKAGRANGKTRQPLAVKLGDDGKIVDLAVDYCAPEDYLVGMSMFIMRRDKLIQVIREMVPHGKYHLERDFILPEYNAGNLKVNVYPFHNVALFNQSVDEYFVNNMKLLEPDVRRSLFRSEIPIYTKVRDAVPTLFGYHGQAANCLIADGCHLFGKAENSVIFREVDIEDGAEVRDSIIMQGSKIGAGASIRYCILDKNVTIRPGTKLLGSNGPPACGRQRRYRMKIAVVASEAAPFVKTGGLGDVMQALPLALSQQKNTYVSLFMPILQSDQVFRQVADGVFRRV